MVNRILSTGLIALVMAAALPLPQSALSLCLSASHFSLEILAVDGQECGEFGVESYAAVPADSDECCHHEDDDHSHDGIAAHGTDDWCLDLHLHGAQSVLRPYNIDRQDANDSIAAPSPLAAFAFSPFTATAAVPAVHNTDRPTPHATLIQLETIRLLC